MQDIITQLREQIENELKNNILPFWCKHAVDDKNGGFYGYISKDLVADAEHDKASVLNARILWTFSTAYRLYKEASYLDMAVRAYEYICRYFINHKAMGVYWLLDHKGNPSELP